MANDKWMQAGEAEFRGKAIRQQQRRRLLLKLATQTHRLEPDNAPRIVEALLRGYLDTRSIDPQAAREMRLQETAEGL